jgi:ParB family chromosome partitioning protein
VAQIRAASGSRPEQGKEGHLEGPRAREGEPTRIVPTSSIEAGKRVRRAYNSIDDLAASLDEYGLLQPIVVRQIARGKFRLVAGGRRLQAVRSLRWNEVSVRVIEASEDEGRVLELIENLQREDLSPQEEADALEELLAERGWTVRELADAIKRSASYVSKRVRVFEDEGLREAVINQGLPVSTAEELLRAPTDVRPLLTQVSQEEGWDQGMVRAAVREMQGPEETAEQEGGRTPVLPPRRKADSGSATGPASESTRPPGLTRQVRELRAALRPVQAWEFTDADRRELRGLFRELVLIARAPTEKRKPIFPPLPSR